MNSSTFCVEVPLPATASVFSVASLRQQLAQVPDPRDPRGVRYSLVDLLTLLILAKLSGEDGMSGMAEWVRWHGAELVSLLKLPRASLPHQTTYERLLERLEVTSLERVVGEFLHARRRRQGLSRWMVRRCAGQFPTVPHKAYICWQPMTLRKARP